MRSTVFMAGPLRWPLHEPRDKPPFLEARPPPVLGNTLDFRRLCWPIFRAAQGGDAHRMLQQGPSARWRATARGGRQISRRARRHRSAGATRVYVHAYGYARMVVRLRRHTVSRRRAVAPLHPPDIPGVLGLWRLVDVRRQLLFW